MIWRAFSLLVTILFGAYFLRFAWQSVDGELIEKLMASPAQIVAVVFAAVLYACIIPISAWAWRSLLSTHGERWSTVRLARILGISQIAKYVPGNIAQHVARATHSLHAGMTGRAYFSSVTQETILAVTASLVVGTIALVYSERSLARLPYETVAVLSGVGIAVATLVLILASVRVDVERAQSWNNWAGRAIALAGGLPGHKATLMALAAYSLNYLLIGVGLWIVARSGIAPASLDFALITAAFSLSWALGFFAPGAPAGLGVREGAMLLLLQGSAPNEDVTLLVLLARVVTMLGDGVCYAAASIIHVQPGSKSA